MKSLEEEVKSCYENAPFPDNLRRAKDFDKELERTTFWIRLNLEFLSKDLVMSRPKTVLCAGCGTGEEALALSDIFPFSKIEAIDISSPSLKIAKANVKKANIKNIYFKKLSIIEDLPRIKKTYDFIYSAGVIHHLSNPELGFNILVDKLEDRGKIVVMLYNSFGLFFYRLQVCILRLLSGNNLDLRMRWVKLFGFDRGKNKARIYDSYINPQIKTFSIGEISRWGKKNNLSLVAIIPPLDVRKLTHYASRGKRYFFRRNNLLLISLGLAKRILGKDKKRPGEKKQKLYLPFYKTLFYQTVFLVLGKGESQFLFEKK